jgi:hypothetical protein
MKNFPPFHMGGWNQSGGDEFAEAVERPRGPASVNTQNSNDETIF